MQFSEDRRKFLFWQNVYICRINRNHTKTIKTHNFLGWPRFCWLWHNIKITADLFSDEFNQLNTKLLRNNATLCTNSIVNAEFFHTNYSDFRKFDFNFPFGSDDASNRVHSTRTSTQTHCIQAMPLNRHCHTCQNPFETKKN